MGANNSSSHQSCCQIMAVGSGLGQHLAARTLSAVKHQSCDHWLPGMLVSPLLSNTTVCHQKFIFYKVEEIKREAVW